MFIDASDRFFFSYIFASKFDLRDTVVAYKKKKKT